MAENSDQPDVNEPAELGDWLTSLGTPESLTNMIPKELRELDISSVFRMLGGVGAMTDFTSGRTTESSAELEGGALPVGGHAAERSIRWLPVIRD